MGWEDNVTKMSDAPMSTETYFPTYTTTGEVTEATAEYPTSDNMDFGYRSQAGEQIGGAAAAIYGMKKGIDIAARYVPSPHTKIAKAATWGIPYVSGVVSSWVGGSAGDIVQSVATGEVTKEGG